MERQQYAGWVVVEEAAPGMQPRVFVEFVDEKGERQREFRGYGDAGCTKAIEWWDAKLGKPAVLESTIRGCYRVQS